MDNEKTPLEKKSRSSEQSPELLEELIEEILSILPAKSLLRFSCVSKSWCSLIGNKRFIKTHHQNISKTQNFAQWRVLFSCTEHGLKQCSLHSFNKLSADPSPFDDPENNHLVTADVIVVGHCNGVLCILKSPSSFFLWNPTTRISRELPKLELNVARKFGFGWDEETDAYKVFAIVSDKEQKIGKVYSTKTDSWKTVDHGCLSLYDGYAGFGIFSSGNIHWLKEDGLQIETFDLNSEVFGMIEHALKSEVGDSMSLDDDTEGCLRVVSENYKNKTIKILSMNKFGVKKSWVEKRSTHKKSTRCCGAVYFYLESLVSPNSEKN